MFRRGKIDEWDMGLALETGVMESEEVGDGSLALRSGQSAAKFDALAKRAAITAEDRKALPEYPRATTMMSRQRPVAAVVRLM
eukprot:9169575-Pyramimonas_sp.AAC.1